MEGRRNRVCCYCGRLATKLHLIGSKQGKRKSLHDLLYYIGGVSIKDGKICRNCVQNLVSLNRRIEQIRRRSMFYGDKKKNNDGSENESSGKTDDSVPVIMVPVSSIADSKIRNTQDDHRYCEETSSKGNTLIPIKSQNQNCSTKVTSEHFSQSAEIPQAGNPLILPQMNTVATGTVSQKTQPSGVSLASTSIQQLPASMTITSQKSQQHSVSMATGSGAIPQVSVPMAVFSNEANPKLISAEPVSTTGQKSKPMSVSVTSSSKEKDSSLVDCSSKKQDKLSFCPYVKLTPFASPLNYVPLAKNGVQVAPTSQVSLVSPMQSTCTITRAPIPVQLMPVQMPIPLVTPQGLVPIQPKVQINSTKNPTPVKLYTNSYNDQASDGLQLLSEEEIRKVSKELRFCTADGIAKCCLEIPRVKHSIQKHIAEEIDFTVRAMGTKKCGCASRLLCKPNSENDNSQLKSIDWSAISDEFKSKIPVLYKMLVTIACGYKNNVKNVCVYDQSFQAPEDLKPKLAMIYAIIMQCRFTHLSEIQRMIAQFLRDEKRIKKVMGLLQALGVCVSFATACRISNDRELVKDKDKNVPQNGPQDKDGHQVSLENEEVNTTKVVKNRAFMKKSNVKVRKLKNKLAAGFRKKAKKLAAKSAEKSSQAISVCPEPIEDIINSVSSEYQRSKVTEDHVNDSHGNRWHIAMVTEAKNADLHRKKGNVVIITKKNLDSVLQKNSKPDKNSEECSVFVDTEKKSNIAGPNSSSVIHGISFDHDYAMVVSEPNCYNNTGFTSDNNSYNNTGFTSDSNSMVTEDTHSDELGPDISLVFDMESTIDADTSDFFQGF